MDRSLEFIEIAMLADPLPAVQAFSVPPGYRIRGFRAGDERHWASIVMGAGEFTELKEALDAFERSFGARSGELPDRMLFLESDIDRPIGTATAWSDDFQGKHRGQVHWVAIVPEHQGKGLANPLVAATLRRISQEFDSAFLTTQTWSWRAVNMYRRFGFEPVIDRPDVDRALAIIDARISASRGGSG